MKIAGKKVLVVGLGRSGAAIAKFCLAQGAIVTVTDQSTAPAGVQELANIDLRLVLGGHRDRDFAEAEIIILSPGVDHRRSEIGIAVKRGIPVLGELELSFRFLKAPAVMVTGTNGKTTVTTLIADMLTQSGFKVFCGGNLGTPLASLVRTSMKIDWAVIEVSSFQLDTSYKLRPRVGVILNITPDHLDRYSSFEDYIYSKYRLLARQADNDLAILCTDDTEIAARVQLAPARVWTYGLIGPRRPGGWIVDNNIFINTGLGNFFNLSTTKNSLVGNFNRLNLLAASLAAVACGASPSAIQQAIDNYRVFRHRLSLIGTINGVSYYNDSKGTNVGAVQAALIALKQRVILLLGGRDKNGRFADLLPLLSTQVAAVICFGEAGAKIHRQIKAVVKSEVVNDLPMAVTRAQALATPDQIVLFSPGCASFDAYTDYAQRGNHFELLVKGLL